MATSVTNLAVDPDWYHGRAHNGPVFLPCHRQLLLQFENGNWQRNIHQSISSDILIRSTVPYFRMNKINITWKFFHLCPFHNQIRINSMGTNLYEYPFENRDDKVPASHS
jgi:hypothetical protein